MCMELYGGISPAELDKQDSMRLARHWFIHNEIKKALAAKNNKASGINNIDLNDLKTD